MLQISQARRQAIETARKVWIRKLIDLSRRNNLLYFRPLKTGTLELSPAASENLHDLLIGESVPAAKLLPDLEGDLCRNASGTDRGYAYRRCLLTTSI